MTVKQLTLVCPIDVQGKINVQVVKLFKNTKCAGQNRRAGQNKRAGRKII